jgi:hypothetical protein
MKSSYLPFSRTNWMSVWLISYFERRQFIHQHCLGRSTISARICHPSMQGLSDIISLHMLSEHNYCLSENDPLCADSLSFLSQSHSSSNEEYNVLKSNPSHFRWSCPFPAHRSFQFMELFMNREQTMTTISLVPSLSLQSRPPSRMPMLMMMMT